MVLNRDAILRFIVAIHFLYTSMVLIVPWLPWSYILSQISIIFLGFSAIIHRESVIHVELLMLVKFFSILLDAINISTHYQGGLKSNKYSYFVLSAFFAIFLLLIKPVMLVLLNKVRQDRLGEDASPTFGKWGADHTPVPGYTPVDAQQVV